MKIYIFCKRESYTNLQNNSRKQYIYKCRGKNWLDKVGYQEKKEYGRQKRYLYTLY